MPGRAVVSLTPGLDDPEKVTAAFLVAVGAAESDRPTLMSMTKESVRRALEGVAVGVAYSGCPPVVHSPEAAVPVSIPRGEHPGRRD